MKPAPAGRRERRPPPGSGPAADAGSVDVSPALPVLPPLAEAWLEELATRRRLSARTLAAYRGDLARLFALTGNRATAPGAGPVPGASPGDELILRMTPTLLRAALARLHSAGLGPRSIARMLSAWRVMFTWAASRGVLAANPVTGLRAPRAPRRLPDALTPDQAVRLAEGAGLPRPFASARADGPAPGQVSGALAHDDPELVLRDLAMIELLYSCGLRLAELVDLDCHWFERRGADEQASRAWLDLAERTVTVLGKGERRRSVPVGGPAIEALEAWLAVRAGWFTPAREAAPAPRALFVSRRGTRLSGRSVQLRLAQRARELGLGVHVHPHMLRHSMASHVLQSSGDLRAVQELLGHADIATTQIYTRLDWQHLARTYDAAHPRARRNTS